MAFQNQLSTFAQKYGPLPRQNHSGLTPLAPSFPWPRTKNLQNPLLQREAHQRNVLMGFTSQELAQLDIISDRDLKEPNLQNAIHPIMARNRWEGQPPHPRYYRDYMYPLLSGKGFWTVGNPDVWKVLEPCLRLASRFLMSMHCLPWVRVWY